MSVGIGIGYIPAIIGEYTSVGQSSGACLENVHFIDKTFQMVKTRTDFLNPISRQYFASAFAETPNLNLEVRHMYSK